MNQSTIADHFTLSLRILQSSIQYLTKALIIGRTIIMPLNQLQLLFSHLQFHGRTFFYSKDVFAGISLILLELDVNMCKYQLQTLNLYKSHYLTNYFIGGMHIHIYSKIYHFDTSDQRKPQDYISHIALTTERYQVLP